MAHGSGCLINSIRPELPCAMAARFYAYLFYSTRKLYLYFPDGVKLYKISNILSANGRQAHHL